MEHDIVLAALNARYGHAALGPRCLLANMGELKSRTVLEEFLIGDPPQRIVERILHHRPRIVGFSIAIWNAEPTGKCIALLRRLDPGIRIVVGGPELRWAEEAPPGADVLIRGEGEVVFPEVCAALLDGRSVESRIDGAHPDLSEIELPYREYRDEDVRQRIISVEASRGCPFGCEFCLSSRETSVRPVPLDRLLPALDELIRRGARGFKFIDRTFNLDLESCRRILDFFHEHWPRNADGTLVSPLSRRQAALGSDRGESFFLHFEVVPDRFDSALITSLARFPAGGVQLEIGVQTLDGEVGRRISRRVDPAATEKNIRALKDRTGVHIHADLIAGLPGEGIDGLARSYDALRAMGPDEIQIGILKLLPGAPIIRHSEAFGMVFNPDPPYDVLETDRIPFRRMQQLKRLARCHEMFVNSGKFRDAMGRVMDDAPSAFEAFAEFSTWAWERTGREHGISQNRQYALVLDYLCENRGRDRTEAARTLIEDYRRIGRDRYLPEDLRPYVNPRKGP